MTQREELAHQWPDDGQPVALILADAPDLETDYPEPEGVVTAGSQESDEEWSRR